MDSFSSDSFIIVYTYPKDKIVDLYDVSEKKNESTNQSKWESVFQVEDR